MARNQGPNSDDPFFRPAQASRNAYADDALPLDAGLTEDDEEEDQQQFRRATKRVPVRRGALPRKTASRVRAILVFLMALAAIGAGVYEVRAFVQHSWRFRLRSDADIELVSESPNSRAQVMEKMHQLMGRNVFQISLAGQKQELENIPWVESATVIRLWPNHLRVQVKERTPVAFVAIGERVALIDAQGVLMEIPAGVKSDYSFPVILGMSENDPLSTRAPRMKTFMRLMRELDGGDAKAQYSRDVDEVDLSDPEDVKVTAKGGSGPILLHLGNEDFLPRFMVFLSNVQKWEQERGKLESVDLRYGREVILNPDVHTAPPAPPQNVEKPEEPPKPQAVKTAKDRHRTEKKRK
jgi:cell division protein FtsQ